MSKNIKIILIFLIFFLVLFFLFFSFVKKRERKIFSLHHGDVFLRVDKIHDIKIKKIHIEKPKNIRAIYMSSWVAGNLKLRNNLVNFIENSRINSLVIDIKDYSGLISFPLNGGFINKYETSGNRVKDIQLFIDELHEKNIYVIGRLTTFQDPLLAEKNPQFAFKRKDNGKIWEDRKGLAFINPQKKEAWNYFLEIAEKSYALGFDEINFDYIRYPSDGNMHNMDYAMNGKTKREVMLSFYQFLDKKLRKKGIPISADLFGFTASREGDLTIGQNMSDALPYFDAVAPMVYPSHYPKKYLNFVNAAAHPYEIVLHEMQFAYKKLEELNLDASHLRTWIQDFDLGANYGVKEVQDQIKASYKAGVTSYMVWDASNKYTKNAYLKNILKDYE